MKNTLFFTIVIAALLTGCEKKDENPITPAPSGTSTFTSTNIKVKPVYFSFAAKDSVASTASWDLKLTTIYAPDDSTRSFPFPGVVLNPTLSSVSGTYYDVKFENVDLSTATGFKKDILDTLTTFSTNNIKTAPVYFSFEKRDTVPSTADWDIKMTVDAQFSPKIILNRQKGVTAKVFDTAGFSFATAGKTTGLASDENDTTNVIGTQCLAYNPTTHKLTPYSDRKFIVKTVNGSRVIFQMLDYYNTAGASGFMKFQFISPELYAIGTNCLKYAGPPTHKLNPYPDRTFVVQTATGAKAKFKLLTYYNELGVSGYMKFQYEVK